ncbi:MAG: carbohydrate-binding family 9-like protein [Armatimonadetes bacterium]|nr:carbohydrate-binding family 9-like protein [Armatimonadota bacterium]
MWRLFVGHSAATGVVAFILVVGVWAAVSETAPVVWPVEIHDDFEKPALAPERWRLIAPLDQWAVVAQQHGHLLVYGNGKWRGVASTCTWLLPPEGTEGSLTVTFKVRAGIHYPPGGAVPAIYDSRVGLLEGARPGEKSTRYFGFHITWPEFSDGGKYRVALGGDWMQTQQPYVTSTTQHHYLRLVLERRGRQGYCRAEVSTDGAAWTKLATGTTLPAGPVHIEIASCWGALAVDAVQVAAAGATKQESTQQQPPQEAAPEAPGTPFIYASHVSAPAKPVIDGRLDEPAWQAAEAALLSVRLYTAAPPSQQTIARACYDDRNLYVAIRCDEARMDLLRIAHRDPTGPVWQDDCVEVFVQPDPVSRWFYYFHAVANALGVGWDDYGRHRQWKCAARQQEKGWTAEMALPFHMIGAAAPQPGDCWGFNVTREERPHAETTSWAPVRGSFHEPERFGRIVFGRPTLRLRHVSLAFGSNGAPLLAAQVESDKAIPAGAKLEAALPHGRTLAQPVKAPGVTRLSLPGDLPSGPLRLHVRLTADSVRPIETVVRNLFPGTSPLASALWPTEVYDGILYVADGQLTHLWMLAACSEGGPEGYEAIIEFPEWLEMLDPPSRADYSNCPEIKALRRTQVTRNGQRMKRVVVEVASPPPATTIDKLELWQEPIVLWLKAAVPKGSKLPLRGQMYTRLKRGSLLEPERVTPVVMLRGERGRQPQRTPVFIWLHGPAVPRRGWRELLAHYRSIGVNGLQEGVNDPDFDALARQYGISTMRSFFWYWWAPRYAAAHPEDLAVNALGRPEVEGTLAAICPEVLLAEESPAFEEAWQNNIGSDRGTPLGWNWNLEGPSPWRACFCQRCMKAFREFAGADPSLPLSFDVLRGNAALSARWIDFAAGQNERLVRKFSEWLARERPGCGLYLNSGGPTPSYPAEGRFRWKAVLPYLAGGMFFRYCNSPLASRTTVQSDSEAWLREVADSGTPIWAMLSAGYMRLDAYNYYEPDLIALQVLQHLAIGYRGIEFWSYRGFDGRFNNALAAATRLVAQIEPWLVEGQRIELPAAAVQAPETVLVVARRHGGRTALFVLNFDAVSPARVRIRVPGVGASRLRIAGSTKPASFLPDGTLYVPPMAAAVLTGK